MIRPDRTDLAARSNADLAQLLPGLDDLPPGNRRDSTYIAQDDGGDLGMHGQTDGRTDPEQCLYSPFGKNFTSTDDGSDWNLYYAAIQTYSTESDRIRTAVYRKRDGVDVFGLSQEWAAGCGQFTWAFPTFDDPDFPPAAVHATFEVIHPDSGPARYRFVARYTSTAASATDLEQQQASARSETVYLAEVRSVVFAVTAHRAIEADDPAAADLGDR